MQEKSVKAKIDLKGKTVLVTGAAGFIGSFLSERLLSDFEDIRVIGFDSVNDYYDIRLKESRLEKLQKHRNFIFIKANLADKDKVSEVFREYSPQIVVNLAAQAGVRYSITNPDAYIESNIIGFYNILEACRHSYDDGATPVEHLVYASSSSVYGSNKKVPYSTGETIRIFNYGNCKRDFTYIDDIVEGVVRVMQGAPERKDGEDGLPVPPYAVYNIGNQNPENLLDFVDILQQELIAAGVLPNDYDFEAHKQLVPMQPGDVPVTYADTTPLERDYGYKPSTDLRTGLRNFARWYKDFYKI